MGFKAAHGLTTYWKGQPLKRKAQSEQGDERPAKKQKQKQKQQKKQQRRFTEPVSEPYEYNEGVQNYLEALEVEKSVVLSSRRRTPALDGEPWGIGRGPVLEANFLLNDGRLKFGAGGEALRMRGSAAKEGELA